MSGEDWVMSMASAGATTAIPSSNGFRIGNVLSRTMGVLTRHVVLFVLVAAAAQLPNLILGFLAPGMLMPPRGAGFATVAIVSWCTIMLATPITQTIMYHAAFQDMSGRPIRFGNSLGIALRRFFPVLGTLICMGVLIAIGFVLLILPGIFVAAMVAVAIPACVVERIGPFASIGRSARLTKGNRWKILGIGLLVLIASMVITGLVAVFKLGLGIPFAAFVNFALQSVLGAFTSLVAVVMYHDLRVAKEGLDTDRIAAVFD
jgi:hypothetical protein